MGGKRRDESDPPVQITTRPTKSKLEWLNEFREGKRPPGRPTYPLCKAVDDAIDALREKVEGEGL